MATVNYNQSSQKVTVTAGNTLWAIAKYVLETDTGKKPTNAQIQTKVNQITKLNNLADANKIYPGQVLKVSSSSADKTSGSTSNAPTITSMGIQSGTDRKVFATWTWGKHDTTDHYEYEWYYDTGDTLEWYYGGGGSSEKRQQITFDPPENAKRVKFMVLPIAMTEKKEG